MLTIQIVCVGKLKEQYWVQACAEYAKRLGSFCKFVVHEVGEVRISEKASDAEIHNALEKEGTSILRLAANGFVVALCIEGREMESMEMAHLLEKCSVAGHSMVSFVIGSSHGLCETVKNRVDFKLSLSKMTFPHQLARVVLTEQIYRSFQIQSGGKYHK